MTSLNLLAPYNRITVSDIHFLPLHSSLALVLPIYPLLFHSLASFSSSSGAKIRTGRYRSRRDVVAREGDR